MNTYCTLEFETQLMSVIMRTSPETYQIIILNLLGTSCISLANRMIVIIFIRIGKIKTHWMGIEFSDEDGEVLLQNNSYKVHEAQLIP